MAKCHICRERVEKPVNMPVPGLFGDTAPDPVAVCRKCSKQWGCPGCGTSLYGSLSDLSICPHCHYDRSKPAKSGRVLQVACVALAVAAFAVGRVLIH